MTTRLREVFASRIDGLPASARELLLRVAFNRDGGVPVASIIEGFGDELDRAEASGLVQMDHSQQRLRFENPLIGGLIVELASPAERRRVHAALAGLCLERRQRKWGDGGVI